MKMLRNGLATYILKQMKATIKESDRQYYQQYQQRTGAQTAKRRENTESSVANVQENKDFDTIRQPKTHVDTISNSQTINKRICWYFGTAEPRR